MATLRETRLDQSAPFSGKPTLTMEVVDPEIPGHSRFNRFLLVRFNGAHTREFQSCWSGNSQTSQGHHSVGLCSVRSSKASSTLVFVLVALPPRYHRLVVEIGRTRLPLAFERMWLVCDRDRSRRLAGSHFSLEAHGNSSGMAD